MVLVFLYSQFTYSGSYSANTPLLKFETCTVVVLRLSAQSASCNGICIPLVVLLKKVLKQASGYYDQVPLCDHTDESLSINNG